MKALFEKEFIKAIRRHSGIRKQVENKIRMIMEHPLSLGEPLKDDYRGFYSCPVKKNFIIIYLYCYACRKKGDNTIISCLDCNKHDDETLKFVLLGPHDRTYGI